MPALALTAARVITIVRGSSNGTFFSEAIDILDRSEHAYLFIGALAALAVIVRAFRQITSRTARRQLRWIAWGTALGVGPFAFGYALPWALGLDPPLALQLTAVPLGLLPPTFGSARDLNSDLDVVRLGQRLVARVVETLVVDGMALMLADERSGDFYSIGDFGFSQPVPPLGRHSSLVARLDASHTVALDDPIAAARFVAEEVEFWRDAGIYYFVPCVFEGGAIAVLALGRKDTDEPFNSEDLALLTAGGWEGGPATRNRRPFRPLPPEGGRLGPGRGER